MLSNPSNNLHNRQRQHRRQNSTPTAFEAVKVPNLPNIQRHGAHRRGMSLDTRRRESPPQDIISANNTNPGYQSTQQHILRETQQQRPVRPGRQSTQLDHDENYLNSPIATPQRQSFDASCTSQYGQQSFPQYTYNGPIDTSINSDTCLFSDSILTPSAFLDFSDQLENFQGGQYSEENSRRSSRRISGGIVDRVMKFENLALTSPQRPVTPTNKNVQSYFPPTPVDSPYHPRIKCEPANQRFLDDYDASMEETIKPRSHHRAGGTFADMRREAEMNSVSSPQTEIMSSLDTFDSAPMPSGNFDMTHMSLESVKNEKLEVSGHSAMSSNISPAVSYLSSPEIAPMTLMHGASFLGPSMHTKPTSQAFSDHALTQAASRRSESVSSECAEGVNDFEQQITSTGVTIDHISTFISGPDPQDGRWLCLFPDCNKRFGRKENIKSHIQTHLGDRQFQCRHCKKCFVRQHDLKRHAKIHSGIKPYPCECGNSFARHDALTRHRQRGMCIGAFEGIVRKRVKRGRPRKTDEDRISKASRTRRKTKAMSSASSTSCSDSTSARSPRSDLDDVLESEPFAYYNYTQQSSMGNSYCDPQSPVRTEYVSPQAVQAASPSAFSTHSSFHQRHDSITSIPSSPAHSHYHTPPGLCESSSSPAPSQHYYDLDHTSNSGDMPLLGNIAEGDEELFSQLERDPGLLMGKFEDEVFAAGGDGTGNGEEMFRSGDVFFGSP